MFILWLFNTGLNEEKLTMECWYEICEDTPEAYYADGLCTCYDYDLMGELTEVKTKYLK